MDAFFAKKGIRLSKPPIQNQDQSLKSSQKVQLKRPIEIFNKNKMGEETDRSFVSYEYNANRSFDIKNQTSDTNNSSNISNGNLSFLSNKEKSFNIPTKTDVYPETSKSFISNQSKKMQNISSASYMKQQTFKSNADTYSNSSAYKDRSGGLKSQSREKINSLPYKNQLYGIQKESSTKAYYSESKQYSSQLQKINKGPANYMKDQQQRLQLDLKSISTQNTYSNSSGFQNYMKSSRPQQPYTNHIGSYKHIEPSKYTQSSQISQRLAFMKQVNEKSMKIRELQSKIEVNNRESQYKISKLQYEIKFLQESTKRLSEENQSNKHLAISQRQKGEKARDEVNKLIFFDQDLKCAKDYDRLTEEYDRLQKQNNKMYNEHYQYVLEMSQIRKQYEKQLSELRNDYSRVKIQMKQSCQKIEKIVQIQSGDDKMLIIKLQNQINFLKKKNEELMETIVNKQVDAQQIRKEMKEMKSQEKQGINAHDEFNFNQIKQTLDQYQLRILRFQNILNEKENIIEDQKEKMEHLQAEMRQVKKDNQITQMKQKSYQNNLKNEVQNLQRTILNEQEMHNKKLNNLQGSLQRKIKQISDKDRFIKSFLLGRIKELQGTQINKIMQKINQYLNFQCQEQARKLELKLKQKQQEEQKKEKKRIQQERIKQLQQLQGLREEEESQEKDDSMNKQKEQSEQTEAQIVQRESMQIQAQQVQQSNKQVEEGQHQEIQITL